jgi:hypothetical protein
MYKCKECNIEFEKHTALASHIRWNHKKEKYTKEGKDKIIESTKNTNDKLYGEYILEDVKCPKCNDIFQRKRRNTAKGLEKAKKYCSRKCANSRTFNDKTKAKLRNANIKNKAYLNLMNNNIKNKRCSSKSERLLAKKLGKDFQRHKVVKLISGRRIDIDICHKTKNIWIESDGIWHFEKVHNGHDFEKSKKRDDDEEKHCLSNNTENILLLRVKNFKYSEEEQMNFIIEQINLWDENSSKVVKLY